MQKRPKVILVGAGPGDPDLITLKAVKALRLADAILYDSLANNELLQYAKPECKLLYVGKRHGCKSAKQEAINELIVHCARKYGTVVRLKGGDPFVFGRGYEELLFAEKHGIEVEVVPGVTSAVAAASSVGIPVTHRGSSEGFWVTTGTLKSGELSPDIALAAQSNATVVVLMGLHKISQIASIFAQYGKANLPVAVVQSGTLPNRRCVVGTVATIVEVVEAEEMASPALLVFGEVARFAKTVLIREVEKAIRG